MTLKHQILFILCLAFSTVASWAQSNKFVNSAFRFATRAEAQMLITELDDYTRNWNQFDIDVRLQKPKGRKSELLQFAMNQTLNWSDKDKERISKAMKSLDTEIKKQKYNLEFPKEIIFVKTNAKRRRKCPGLHSHELDSHWRRSITKFFRRGPEIPCCTRTVPPVDATEFHFQERHVSSYRIYNH